MYGNYGGAIFVMAIGAILKFAVTGHVSGISIATIGVILLLAGIVWLVLAVLFDLSARRRAGVVAVERERVVEPDARVW
jgi:L-cystine uptake protein TcyP (sodium:dicarboxylate symporter family)